MTIEVWLSRRGWPYEAQRLLSRDIPSGEATAVIAAVTKREITR